MIIKTTFGAQQPSFFRQTHKSLSWRCICARWQPFHLDKWSKTLQAHERMVLIPVAPIPGHPLCPVQAYLDMVAALPATKDEPLFVVSDVGTLQPLTSSQLTKVFKDKLTQCGHDARSYSIHSLRRGGVTFAFDCQVEPLLIKTHGRLAQ